TALRTRHAHHIAKGRKDHAVGAGNRNRIVDPTHRQHTHRATGAMYQVDVAWQHVLDAVFVDRVRVTAANFHQLQRPAFAEPRDLGCDAASEIPVPIFVHIFHAIYSISQGCRMQQESVSYLFILSLHAFEDDLQQRMVDRRLGLLDAWNMVARSDDAEVHR